MPFMKGYSIVAELMLNDSQNWKNVFQEFANVYERYGNEHCFCRDAHVGNFTETIKQTDANANERYLFE